MEFIINFLFLVKFIALYFNEIYYLYLINMTALHISIKKGHFEIVKLLLGCNNKPDVNLKAIFKSIVINRILYNFKYLYNS